MHIFPTTGTTYEAQPKPGLAPSLQTMTALVGRMIQHLGTQRAAALASPPALSRPETAQTARISIINQRGGQSL
jgi:hypothetical protein